MKSKFENFLTQTSQDAPEDHASIKRNVTQESRDTIQKIQMEKQEFVDKLRAWRSKFFGKSLDDESDIESLYGNRTLEQAADGSYCTYLRGGQKVVLSRGEVFAAREWGIFWRLDDSIDKHDQQAIMAHQMRSLVENAYNKQLLEFGRVNKLSDDRKRDTYAQLQDIPIQLENRGDGFLAEKIVISLLKQLEHDSTLSIRVEAADVYEDVENKIDFIVTIESRRRGVEIDEQSSHIGVQLTMRTDTSKVQEKEKQIRASKQRGDADVDDIVLLSLPLKEVRSLFNTWRYNKDGSKKSEKALDPRGPNCFMSQELKESIVGALMSKLPENVRQRLSAENHNEQGEMRFAA